MKVADAEAEAGRGLKTAAGCVHADRGRSKWVVGREHQGSPILTAFVGGVWGPGQDVMPSGELSYDCRHGGRGRYSRMLDSEGCAVM